MSCADWMTADGSPMHPDALTGEVRRRLTHHLQECEACRRAALETDPTLVFSLRSEVGEADADSAAMIASVRSLRRVRGLEMAPSRNRRLTGGGIAAAVLGAMLLMLVPSGGERRAGSFPVPGQPGTELSADRDQQLTGFGTLPPRVQESPILEDLDRQEARVYQVDEEDLSVVMVVDESLDL
jgi:hypothetical protein